MVSDDPWFFLLAIQDLQPKKKPGSLQNAFEAIDLDESGAISFEEFKKCGWTASTWAQPWNFPNNNFLRESEWKCNRDTNFMGIKSANVCKYIGIYHNWLVGWNI
jgi:hypothetical protein